MAQHFTGVNFVNKITSTQNELWDGSPITLQPNESVQIKSTNGNMVLAYLNTDTQNNTGELAITYGGSKPDIKEAAPLQNAPNIIIKDYGGDVVQLTNISQQSPIKVTAYGPGFGSSEELPATGQLYSLEQYQSRTTISQTSYQRLVMNAEKTYTIFTLYVGTTPKVYCVNTPDTAGVPVEDYTAVTSSNSYPITDNFLGKTLYVINLSPDSSQGAQVSLTTL